jgi:hypothetical protein
MRICTFRRAGTRARAFELAIALGLALAAACARDDVTRELGGPCADDAECALGARCLRGPEWPEGFCTHACADADDCPAGASCAADVAACLLTCWDDRDCELLGEQWGCADDLVCRGAP